MEDEERCSYSLLSGDTYIKHKINVPCRLCNTIRIIQVFVYKNHEYQVGGGGLVESTRQHDM